MLGEGRIFHILIQLDSNFTTMIFGDAMHMHVQF
jgi:hypothetical protein